MVYFDSALRVGRQKAPTDEMQKFRGLLRFWRQSWSAKKASTDEM